jgi:U3 small nucleolar RNA-associated protein 14
VNAKNVLESINFNTENSSFNEHQSESDIEEEEDDGEISHFNEKLMRLICLNQAIARYRREMHVLIAEKDSIVNRL